METATSDESLTGHALVFSDMTFEQLGVEGALLEGLHALGFAKATEVQKRTFPILVEGRDILVQSKTGSGKTGAFGIPIMQRMAPHDGDKRPRMLALCPTRELASQVERELNAIGKAKGLRTVAIYGGVGFDKQLESLQRGVDIVVGTPGRVMDLVEKGSLDISRISALVLDEADEMLSMGFWDDVMWMLKRLPKARQTLLFSATIPFAIERAARSFLTNPERVDLSGSSMTAAAGIQHFLYTVDARLPKPRNMLYLLEVERPTSCIVFCNTKADVELLSNYLGNQGYDIEALSGDLSQNQRERVLNAIKSGRLKMMVATDVAARGIDISNLSHVFNYNLPEDPEVYIHRAGRTGRIGKKGICASMVSGTDEQTRTVLKRDFALQFIDKELPAPSVIAGMRSERLVKELIELAEQAEVSQHTNTADAVLASDKSKTIVAFLLKQYLSRANRPSSLAATPTTSDDAGERSPREREQARAKPREQREPRPAVREQHEQREERAPRPEHTGPKKLFVNLGEADGLAQGGLSVLLSEMSGAPANAFSGEEVRKTSSFIRVSDEAIEQALTAHGKDRNGKQLVVEKARRR